MQVLLVFLNWCFPIPETKILSNNKEKHRNSLSVMEVQDKFSIHIDIMEYNSIVSAFNKVKENLDMMILLYHIFLFHLSVHYFFNRTKGTRDMYLVLINDMTPK